MKKLAITIIATAAISAANTDAQTTQRLTADRTNEYGLIYTLPSTVIDITMRIERTVKRPGEFNKYAKKYLNIAKPITKTWFMPSSPLCFTVGHPSAKGVSSVSGLIGKEIGGLCCRFKPF